MKRIAVASLVTVTALVAACGLFSDAPSSSTGSVTPTGGDGEETGSDAGSTTLLLADGVHHTCARMPDRTAKCWGESGHGESGPGAPTFETGAWYAQPTPTTVPGLSNVAQLALGLDHTCALLVDGRVACFGANFSGQCGFGGSLDLEAGMPRPADVPSPTFVPSLAKVVELAVGDYHTCARLEDRTVRCFGRSNNREPDNGVPTAIEGLIDVAQLAAGTNFTCARHLDGTVSCWGENDHGQLGRESGVYDPAPRKVPGVANVVEIAAGGTHTCVRHADSTVTCWGNNLSLESGARSTWVSTGDAGPWGDAGYERIPSPVGPTRVEGVSGAVRLSLGVAASCAVTDRDRVVCWGTMPTPQVGDAYPFSRPTHVATELPFEDVAQITVGSLHACVRKTSDAVLCFGMNLGGMLGDGTTTPRAEPVSLRL